MSGRPPVPPGGARVANAGGYCGGRAEHVILPARITRTFGAAPSTIPKAPWIWLEADVLIRQAEQRRPIFGRLLPPLHRRPRGNALAMKPYDFNEVVATLNPVQPYGWEDFSHYPYPQAGAASARRRRGRRRLEACSTQTRSPTCRNSARSISAQRLHGFRWNVHEGRRDNWRRAARITSPAWAAGIAPATKLIAVNGLLQYTPDVLNDALQAARNGSEPLELLVKDGEFYRLTGWIITTASGIRTWSVIRPRRIC